MKDFEVLILDGAYPSSVTMSRDILDAAHVMAPRVGTAGPTWGLYSLRGGRVHLRDGISVETRALPPRKAGTRSVLVLPGLGPDPNAIIAFMATPDGRAVARRVRAHVEQGGELAASCSAVFVLHAAGVLAGRTVTTTWWLADVLRQASPTCTVDAKRMVCVDGPVTTAGAAFAHADLLLHMLRRRFGPRLSEAVGNVLLLEHRYSQSPFEIPHLMASGDALVRQLAARLEAALPDIPPVPDLASALCVSERTLARHVRQATGKSTMDFIQGVRVQRARTLLHNSRMTVEQVAAQVGYRDATALRRLMRKATGAAPGRFRAIAAVDG